MSCHKPTLESLQRQGVRMTAQRALILEDLFHHPGHHTADDIHRHIGDRLPGLNRATVYRTLDLLQEAGVVTAFAGADGVTGFEVLGAHPHHHLHCRACGAEIHLDPEPVEAFDAAIRRRHGFTAELEHLYLTGLCADCEGRLATQETQE